jgi:hypothetical protein
MAASRIALLVAAHGLRRRRPSRLREKSGGLTQGPGSAIVHALIRVCGPAANGGAVVGTSSDHRFRRRNREDGDQKEEQADVATVTALVGVET